MIVTVRVVEDLARRLRARADRIGASAIARATRAVIANAEVHGSGVQPPVTASLVDATGTTAPIEPASSGVS